MKTIKVLGLVSLIFLFSCGEKLKEAKNAIEMAKSMKNLAENMEKNLEGLSERAKERKERGDTVSMHFEELAKFLPDDYSGFSKDGDLDGNSTNMAGMSFSNAEQDYKNEAGDKLKIAIVDYNASYGLYSGLMAFYGSGLEIDNTNERIKSFKISDDVKGWEVYKKKQKRVEVFAGVAERFYITVEASNQEDSEFVREVLTEAMDLDKLSAM